jgi:hypothetical protein
MRTAYDMNQRARELADLWIKGEHEQVLSALSRILSPEEATADSNEEARIARRSALAVAVYRNLRDRHRPEGVFTPADLFLALLDARGEGAL